MADAILADTCESGIYRICNLINGNRYIGSTKKLPRRMYLHRWNLRRGSHPNAHLQSAWNKFGEKEFSFDVIERCLWHSLLEREQFWIDFEKPEYNIAPKAGGNTGIALSAATKRLISIANKGNSYCLGREMSPSTRAKISAANTGKITGRKQSPEHISKRMQAHIGAKRSAETRAKLSAARIAYYEIKRGQS
jgi:group I intron endonuclease